MILLSFEIILHPISLDQEALFSSYRPSFLKKFYNFESLYKGEVVSDNNYAIQTPDPQEPAPIKKLHTNPFLRLLKKHPRFGRTYRTSFRLQF